MTNVEKQIFATLSGIGIGLVLAVLAGCVGYFLLPIWLGFKR